MRVRSSSGRNEMRTRLPGKSANGMCSANEPDHTRFRKILNPAFSESSVLKYEPVIKSYVDQLVNASHNVFMTESRQANVVDWFTFSLSMSSVTLAGASRFNVSRRPNIIHISW
jgi:cytochrome P450